MKYKISEVSKILNIPIDTLRYLETKDIVKPSKDDNNNYRYYEAWDINFLTEFKKFRSFDFSVSEVKEILHSDDLDSFVGKINGRQEYFENKLKYYELLKQKNERYRCALNSIEKNLWNCFFTKLPEIYYFLHRSNDKYETKDKFNGLFEVWIDYFPFIDTIVEMKKEDVQNRNRNNDFEWGFAIQKQYADAFQIPRNNLVKQVDGISCVYTVICARDKGSFSLKLLDKAVTFIGENGYRLSGDVIGNLLARVHEQDGYRRYIEVWLPVMKI